MKHWGKALPEGSKFPIGVGKTIFPEERKELDRQAARQTQVNRALNLKKMPIVTKPEE